MTRTARLVTAIAPVLGLVALWGWSDYLSRQGTDWDVEIEGYDPRDLLRGHYVEFTYDWPEPVHNAEDSEDRLWRSRGGPQILCLYGEAPALDRAVSIQEAEVGECAHLARSDGTSVYGLTSLERGRFYVGQDRALEIEEEMRDRDQRGIVTIRQREDGTITPLAIRFRPLTEEEVSVRDGESGEPAIERLMMAEDGEPGE
ncbi:MAG: GDYXXLXY domain-containing protein [Pseudomonadota bacterium]